MSSGDGGERRPTNPADTDLVAVRRRERLAVVASLLLLAVMLVAASRVTHQPPARTDNPPAPTGSGASMSPTPGASPTWRYDPVAARPVTTTELAALPAATTDTTIAAAPVDPDRTAGTDGAVVHNEHTVAVYDAPGGAAVAQLPPTQASSPTWLPVVDRQPGWVRVLLPNRPNGSSGWLTTTTAALARTPYEVRVDVGDRRLELWQDGHRAGRWTVAVGATATPTPIGRTFVLASITDPAQAYSPVILPLGTHSTVLASYHNGPATTALHTWPDRSVFGRAASNGCLRIPPDALHALQAVPLGTLVRIDP